MIPDKIRYQGKTYSQWGEDRILLSIFNNLKIKHPSFIDIGAHHPYYINNTALLYSTGSRGINIEPDPHLFQQIAKVRKRDINLPIGIMEKPGSLHFYIMESPTLNTFSEEWAHRCETMGHTIKKVIDVPVDTIANIISKHHNNVFPDLLSLDAEGVDEIIVDSFSSLESKPKVICVETAEYAIHKIYPEKNTVLTEKILNAGYFIYADTYVNTIFIDKTAWENRLVQQSGS